MTLQRRFAAASLALLLVAPAGQCAEPSADEGVDTLYADALHKGAMPGTAQEGASAPLFDAAGGWLDGVSPVEADAPSRNPTTGWGLSVLAFYVYRPLEDKDSPPWSTGIGAGYTQNESWGGGLFHRMNLDHDRWRMLFTAAGGAASYDFYVIGADAGDSGSGIPLRQRFAGGRIEILRETFRALVRGCSRHLRPHRLRSSRHRRGRLRASARLVGPAAPVRVDRQANARRAGSARAVRLAGRLLLPHRRHPARRHTAIPVSAATSTSARCRWPTTATRRSTRSPCWPFAATSRRPAAARRSSL